MTKFIGVDGDVSVLAVAASNTKNGALRAEFAIDVLRSSHIARWISKGNVFFFERAREKHNNNSLQYAGIGGSLSALPAAIAVLLRQCNFGSKWT